MSPSQLSSPHPAPLQLEQRAGRVPLLHAEVPGDPQTWAADHRSALLGVVADQGAVLVRGLGLADAAQAAAVFSALCDSLMVEREAFASRRSHGGGVYSSTTWPSNQQMCMHHELSYALEFPGLMLFGCLQAPGSGGATALASSTAVLEALPTSLVERFEREGWLLVRNYNDEIGASFEDAFGTEDRAVVEAYCRANAIEYAWQADGGLRTRQRRRAVVRHPVTGRRCWFNQIAFLNEWTIAPEIREYLVEEYGAEGLPFTTAYGNGDAVQEEVVQLLNQVYEAHTYREPWEDGDLMLVDNIASAHSREPFEGRREVVVGLADPVRLSDGSATTQVRS